MRLFLSTTLVYSFLATGVLGLATGTSTSTGLEQDVSSEKNPNAVLEFSLDDFRELTVSYTVSINYFDP